MAQKIKTKLENDPTVFSVRIFHRNVRQTLERVFTESDIVIGIMAVGIMVRNISPLLRDKYNDPGVIVIDENGSNVISLLSGHLGGANDFTLKLSNLIGGKAIITTSTDLNGFVGIDSLARRYFWEILDKNLIRHFNASIIEGCGVELSSRRFLEGLIQEPELKRTYTYKEGNLKIIEARCNGKVMRILPRRLVVGIGTRRGVEASTIITFIEDTLKFLKIPTSRIDCIATGYMKKHEPGIYEAAARLGITPVFIPGSKLRKIKTESFSDFVYKKFGVGSVCESAALSAAGKNSKLVIRKTSRDGVALAVAVSGPPKTFYPK